MALLMRAMNITFRFPTKFSCFKGTQIRGSCRSPALVPGESVDISVELDSAIHVSGFVYKDIVPKNRILFLDNCWGGGCLKTVSDDCRFVTPNNDNEWDVVEPFLKELAQRRVFFLTEVNLPGIKEKCRKSFYSSSDGTLINKTFEHDDLVPEKMAEDGMVFAGDASNDATVCYFNSTHRYSNWAQIQARYRYNHRFCTCMSDLRRRPPVFCAEDGQKVPVKMYFVTPPERSEYYCKSATLITHSGAPIKILPLSEVMSTVDVARLALADSSIQGYRKSGKIINKACFESIRESINLTHFSGLLRDYESVSLDFTTQLQRYKNELHTQTDLGVADHLLKELTSSSVMTEVGEIITKLATLQMAKETLIQLKFLPAATHKSFSDSMELVAIKELRELADAYQQKHFVDDCLNGLVINGTLGCIFTDDYFNASERSEKLMSLLAKGTELLQVLIGISDVIKEVLEPFMEQSAEPVDLQASDKA